MKDKRQRMAMAWPYGISDPNLYAYIMNAAASLSQYPYAAAALPNPATSPALSYYASLGLQRAAAAYTPYGFPSPLRPGPRSDLLPGGVPSPLIRPTAEPHPGTTPSTPSAPSLPCGLHPPRDHHPSTLAGAPHHPHPHGSLLGGSAATCTASPGEPCSCHLFYGGLAPTSLPAPHPVAAPISHPPHIATTSSTTTSSSSIPSSQPSLFQPYKTEAERA